MHFKTILITVIFSAGLAAGLTLPEAVEADKRQCLPTNSNCLLPDAGACCSGVCCCGISSPFGDGCSNTACTIQQEEGLAVGVSRTS
ncbi:hypothetical protein GGX14DRAFT_428030 [Mycena pura]|uniref:Uncharacterized protein n=1 Tax=Mycena pura TaxID=153505 RepID=A0AAD6YMI4_9AGAR|nr:hypothetical protein GGX14DRAFT_428030 [Mycena pura]